MPPEAGGDLSGEGKDVVGDKIGRADSGELAQVGLDGAGLAAGGGVVEACRAGRVFRTGRAGRAARTARDSRTARTTRANRTARAGRGPAAGDGVVDQAPQGQQVGLAVEAEGVVDAAVQVRGDLGDAGDGPGAHEVDGAVAGDEPAGEPELAVEEGVEQGAAVDLGVDELVAAAAQGGGGLELEGGGVGVGAHDAHARAAGGALGQHPGDEGPVAHDAAAPRQVPPPGGGLLDSAEADGPQAPGRLGGGVVAGGGGGDEVDEAGGVGVDVGEGGRGRRRRGAGSAGGGRDGRGCRSGRHAPQCGTAASPVRERTGPAVPQRHRSRAPPRRTWTTGDGPLMPSHSPPREGP